MIIIKLIPLFIESLSFSFDLIPSPQIAGDSFFVRIHAHDPDTFNQIAFLSLRPLPVYLSRGMEIIGEDENIISFNNGLWNGFVRVFFASDSIHLKCELAGYYDYSNQFTVLPNSPERLQILLPGEHKAPGYVDSRGRYGSPLNITAGEIEEARIYITDKLWNPVGEGESVVYLTSENPFPILPPPESTNAGSLHIHYNLRAAGNTNHLYLHHNPTGSDTLLSDTSSSFKVIPRDFTQLLLTVPGETLLPGDTLQEPLGSRYPGVSGGPSPQNAGSSFPVTVYAVDDCWNVVNTAPPDIIKVEVYRFPSITQTSVLTNGVADFSFVSNTAGVTLLFHATDTTDANIENSYIVPVDISGGSVESVGTVLNFPNPFGKDYTYTTIHYYLTEDADVSIRIFDKFGNPVWSCEEQGRGGDQPNTVSWDGVNYDNRQVASGVYFLYIRATNRTKTVAEYKRKIAVIR